MARKSIPATLGEALRAAIEANEEHESIYALARRAGVPQMTIWRFVRRERDMHVESASRIAKALGLRLGPEKLSGKSVVSP